MPKAIDHDQRRRDIIDVTWNLIVKGGLEAATMREIASEAGFANGALKHYFPGKDDIITGAYQRSMDQVMARIAAASEGLTGIDALRAIARATTPLDAESRDSARVLLAFWERGLSSEEIRVAYGELLRTWHDDTISRIADCRAAGTIDTDATDEELAGELIMMNVGGTVLSAIAPEFATPAMLNAMVDAFFRRVGAPEPARSDAS
ncbi:TetR/AcrR family transcriptional regulator [Microbacterium sp. NPDC057659]|uniref:TetR/AcrR family transcriptional regulator n=1 Tax=Microbacterium sp. NPDC057659 TaxID=3346198 RepID=UPI00366EA02F